MKVLPAVRRPLVLCAFALGIVAPACALDPPTGPVVLTISGDIEVRNSAEGARFDLAMLEKLPQRSFDTKTPWYPTPRRFTGVPLQELLAAVGARGKTGRAVALNDYRVAT